MKSEVMLDLETLGTGNKAAIVAIGACFFDPQGEGPLGTFYARVDPKSSAAVGMEIDLDTILWWLKQSDEARKSTFEGEAGSLEATLNSFNNFLRTGKAEAVWGNGATFDNVIIRSAYKAVGLTPAWHFRGDKCYRTVMNLLPKEKRPEYKRSGTSHNALEDAITQALMLQKTWKILGL